MEQQLTFPSLWSAPLPGCTALGRIVRPERHCDDIQADLTADGWEPIGDGCYTAVYRSADNMRVLKFANGSGQRATLQAALSAPGNPHFPRIFGVSHDVERWGFVCEVEALEELDDEDFLYDRSWNGSGEYVQPDYVEFIKRWPLRELEWNPNRFRGRPNGPMKDAIRALIEAKINVGASWDVHPGNLMLRPITGELVLNDLLA